MEGTIYILINPALKDKVKIGKTSRSADERASELFSTGVPLPFFVAFEQKVSNCDAAEREIHEALNAFRVNRDREFFNLSLKEAIRWVAEICDEFSPVCEQPSGAPPAVDVVSDRTSRRKVDAARRPQKQPRPFTFNGTKYVYVACAQCRRKYSVTMHRLELGTTCPACHHYQQVAFN